MLVLGAAILPSAADAQGATRMVGRVVSEAGAPVPAAEITVGNTFWRTESSTSGHFAISLPPGEWTLLVRRIGFAPGSLHLAAGAGRGGDTLLVTLAESPAALRGIVVRAERSPAMSESITAENARQAPPLGEADLFRVLPLLPAVSQPNDLLGRFHLAGGASDEHGVTLDGHPMQSPLHAHNLLGAFNVAALERADVSIHHLPASVDGILSGLVQLESRRVGARPTREVVTSLLSTSVTVTQPSLLKGVDLLASGRVTYIDRFLRAYAHQRGDAGDDLNVPGYRDALIRVGHRRDERVTAEVLGYVTRDSWHERREDPADRALSWGEHLVGVRTVLDLGSWTASARATASDAAIEFRRRHSVAGQPWGGEWIDVRQRRVSGEASVQRHAQRWRARGGVAYDVRTHVHDWRSASTADLFSQSVPSWYLRRSRQSIARGFADASMRLAPALHLAGGVHVSHLEGRAFAAPRLLVTAQVASRTRIDLAVDRRYQFDAILGEPEEGSITQPVFLLSTPRSVTSGAVSLAWERPAADSAWSLHATTTLFARRYQQRTTPAPPAQLTDAPLSVQSALLFARGSARTAGGSVGAVLSRPAGTTAQVSYTYQRATHTVDGLSQPVAWDAPHQASLFASARLWRRWSATTAFQYRSGPAATPVLGRIVGPSPYRPFGTRVIPGEPFSLRHPGYTRLDLGLRRSWRPATAEWTLSLQALNVLRRGNTRLPSGSYVYPCGPRRVCPATSGKEALPLVPSIGLEVRW